MHDNRHPPWLLSVTSSQLSRFSSHLFQQSRGHGERIPDQAVVCHDDRHARVRAQIVRLRRRRELLDVGQYRVHVLLQRVEGVLEVVGVVLLLGVLVVRFARHVEVVGGTLIVLLQYLVEKDVPNLRGDLARLCLEEQILEVVPEVLDDAIEVHGLAEDGRAVAGEEAVLGEEGGGVGRIAKGYGEG